MAEAASSSVEIVAAADLTPLRRKELEDWFSEDFPRGVFEWAKPAWYLVVRNGGDSIGRVGILAREISVSGNPVRVGGINGVATRPQWRRRGVATLAMRAAADFMARTLRCEHALLLCGSEVSPLYAKLGWKTVPGPTTFAQPSGVAVYPGLTMVLEISGPPFPSGPIDMRGLPW